MATDTQVFVGRAHEFVAEVSLPTGVPIPVGMALEFAAGSLREAAEIAELFGGLAAFSRPSPSSHSIWRGRIWRPRSAETLTVQISLPRELCQLPDGPLAPIDVALVEARSHAAD